MKTLCVDFDGVIHSYASGWTWKDGVDVIPDPPVAGSFEWLERMTKRYTICIYSARSKIVGGIVAMKAWFLSYGMPTDVMKKLEFPTQKPAAWLTIDDRAWRFDGPGTFPSNADIDNFKPWYKRTRS